MAIPLLRKKTMMIAKFESTEGSMASITGTDAKFLASDVVYKAETTLITRMHANQSFARKKARPSTQLARITFKTEVVGSSAAGTEPAWATLIKGCGFKVTTTASVSNTYDPVTNPSSYDATGANGNVSLTIWVYEDGLVKKARGCRGTFRITGEASGLCFIEWEFLGIHDSVAALAFPNVASGYDAAVPPILESASFSFQGLSAGVMLIRTFNVDVGNSINPRFDASSSKGVLAIFIGDREVKGEIDPEQLMPATFDEILNMNTPTVGTFSVTIGTTAGNRMVISAPAVQAQIMDVAEGDKDGILTNTLSLSFSTPDIEHVDDKEIRFVLN